ncbi:helix-turn-helix domain-containing protein [Streptomyces sp. NPDC049954]|uniref:TetR/AcrR family transcriptional regulator n=1 Tax=Streptomyces sp. NPDC049954 TaxID=3155779 RepID=UPI003434F63A
MSLRERKKAETRRRLREVAVELFGERGFDGVSVAEIAEVAGVSKMTVFNYFGSKEDLLLAPMEEHVGDAARAVRERAVGESAVAASRRAFLAALDAGDPSVGASAATVVVRMRRLIVETPALLARALTFSIRAEKLLAEEMAAETGDAQGALLAAAQLMAVRNALAGENFRRVLAGATSGKVVAESRVLAERAYAQLESGLGAYATRTRPPEGQGESGTGVRTPSLP